MEKRIEKLDDFAGDANQRLARIETRVGGIDERLATSMATKADVSEAKFAVIVASISTMVALAAIVFAIARYFPAS